MRRTISMIVMLVLATVGPVLSPSSASAQPTGSMNVVLGNQGIVSVRGLIVTVPVHVTCTFSGQLDFADVFVDLRQRIDRRTVARGFGFQNLSSSDCNGIAHTFRVQVLAENAPFRRGQALAIANGTACFSDPATGEGNCAMDRDGPKVIRLVRR